MADNLQQMQQPMQQPMQQQYPQYPSYTPYGYNPYMSNMQRLQHMEQQYPHLSSQPQQSSQQQQPQQMSQMLKGRVVTGIDEAKASTIDFDGSAHIFTDIPNGKIYTKQLSDSGKVVFNTYILQEIPVEQPTTEAPAMASIDIDKIIQEATTPLSNEIEALKQKMSSYEEMFK